jgi:hypothetical protein
MSRNKHSYVLAAAIVASAAFAAPAPASAGTSNPCALVTSAEATTAMGVASLPGKAHAGRLGSSCRYYSADHTKNVFVQIVSAGDMMGAVQIGGKPVSGIGDKAFWASGSMFVKKGGSFVQVGLYLNAKSMEKMDPAIVPLAKTVASRM